MEKRKENDSKYNYSVDDFLAVRLFFFISYCKAPPSLVFVFLCPLFFFPLMLQACDTSKYLKFPVYLLFFCIKEQEALQQREGEKERKCQGK